MVTKLLFCKSKVFVHPSSSSSENIPGFLLVVDDPLFLNEQTHETVAATHHKQESYYIIWFPENNLSDFDKNWLFKNEELLIDNNEIKIDNKIINKNLNDKSYQAFSTKIIDLYSIQFRLPSPTNLYYGSIVFYLKSQLDNNNFLLPILFFHDDICQSTIKKQKKLNKNFDPFNSTNDMYWGGSEFKNLLIKIIDLKRTNVDSTFYLINPTLDDLRNFSPSILLNNNNNNSSNGNNLSLLGDSKSLWDKYESSKWSILSKVADLTSKTTNYIDNMIQSNYYHNNNNNSNNIYVNQILSNPKVQEIQDDFDSAKIYLTKWSLNVKQESEKYQKLHKLNEIYLITIKNQLGFDIENNIQFTDYELNKAIERNFLLTENKWESFFDSNGFLNLTIHEIKDFIFHGNIESMKIRKELWLFLLNVYPWDSSTIEREQLNKTLKFIYENDYKMKWEKRNLNKINEPDDDNNILNDEEYWNDQIFRIEKDVLRNDRTIDIYKYNTYDGKKSDEENEENIESSQQWEIKNPHLIKLKKILISYNIYNPNLGYVQGMTDILSIIYYIIRDESLSFWCFVKMMERMERNFLRDQSGIKDQMITLSELIQLLLPKLSEHLIKCESQDLFFCFRFLLVWFKREFKMIDIFSIWEIFLTDFYSSQYQIFFMLSILQKNSHGIINNLNKFDEIIKFFNELKINNLDWKDLMIRSELLFINFKKTIELIERENELKIKGDKSVIEVSDYLKKLLSTKPIIVKEKIRTKDSIK